MARTVSVIPAKQRFEIVDATISQMRVAAYCRVSTDNEEQLSSYEAQVNYYTGYIKNNPQWEMGGIYADEGISGTNTKKRTQFNKLIKDCMDGKIDMIVTKSISRFARNTLDCLKYIRKLKGKNVAVFFEKDKVDKDTQRFKINKMLDFLERQPDHLIEYDDKLVRQLVERITVNDENLIIKFKSGIEIEEEV